MDNLISFGITLIVGILTILIDGAIVLTTLIEEVQTYYGGACFGIGLTANKPVVGAFGLAGYGNILGRLCLKILRVFPVASYVADKLEGIIVFLVVFGQVGSHLQWTVHHKIE